jgi:tight adherence protein B
MNMTTILGAFLVLNIAAYVAVKRRKPVAATADGMSVEDVQAAMSRREERFGLLNKFMRRRKGTSLIQRNLITAGLPLRPAEFLMANLFCFAAVLLLGSLHIRSMPYPHGFFALLKQGLWFLFYGWFGFKAPQMVLQFLANKRRMTLEVQLADALAIVSSALKGGYSFVQGLSMASEQLPPPISGEVARVIRLIQLGLDTPRALEQLAERVNSYDYDMTVSAANIQLASGGNLSQMLESIAATIRDRIRLRRDIAALTAQGRISGGILISLPIGIALMLRVINPEYFSLLTTTDLGNNLLYGAATQQAIGIYWIKKLLDFDN